jgi:hypothetical protein
MLSNLGKLANIGKLYSSAARLKASVASVCLSVFKLYSSHVQAPFPLFYLGAKKHGQT